MSEKAETLQEITWLDGGGHVVPGVASFLFYVFPSVPLPLLPRASLSTVNQGKTTEKNGENAGARRPVCPAARFSAVRELAAKLGRR